MNKFIELTKTQAKEIIKRAFCGNSDQHNSTMSTIDSFGWVEGDYKRKIVVCDECRSNQTLLLLGYTNECGIFFKWCDLFRIQAVQYLKEIEETVKNDNKMKEPLSTKEAVDLLYKAGKALRPRTFKTALDHILNISLGAKIYAEYLGSPHPLCLVEETNRGIVTVREPIADLNPFVGMEYLKKILDKRYSKGDEIKTDSVKADSINSEKIEKVPMYGLRKCKVNGQEGYLFHRWVENSKAISKYPTLKNPTEFIESRYPMGIVEGPDGKVTTINPEAIQFDKDVRTIVKCVLNGRVFFESIETVKEMLKKEAAKYYEAMEVMERRSREFDDRMNKVGREIEEGVRKTCGTRADYCGIDEPTPKVFEKVVYKGLSSDKAKSWWNAMLNARDTDLPVILNAKPTRIIDATLMSKSLGGGFVDYEVCVRAIYRD